MFPWATKEYLLWNMTIGQILMYNNYGWAIKNGTSVTQTKTLSNMSANEVRKFRDDMRSKMEKIESVDKTRELMQQKYGAI